MSLLDIYLRTFLCLECACNARCSTDTASLCPLIKQLQGSLCDSRPYTTDINNIPSETVLHTPYNGN